MAKNDINFNVTIYFRNGVTVERSVDISKAFSLSMKENVLIEENAEYAKVSTVKGTIVIPITMAFVVPTAPSLKPTEKVSRYMLYRRDGGRCAYCGKEISQKEATIDHIFPKSKGGKTEWENVVLACKKCNRIKDNKTLEESGMTLRVKPYNPKRRKSS
jgi:hypothetical protein